MDENSPKKPQLDATDISDMINDLDENKIQVLVILICLFVSVWLVLKWILIQFKPSCFVILKKGLSFF